MENILDNIRNLSFELYEQIKAIRREIHKFPELAYDEYKTSELICNVLSDNDIEFVKGIAGTGVVALIRGQEEQQKCIAIRADMDALPVQEENEVEYKSLVPGVMHACGHDAHIASALGTAIILNQLKQYIKGIVKIIFQPAEEKLPGGALNMINKGILQNPAPASVIAQHVLPELPTGKIGIRSGNFMASADEIYITVKGKGGHGAMPHLITDNVLITSYIVVALQHIISRKNNPFIPSVLSFGRIQADGQTNIIPDKVEISGTFRTFDEKWRYIAHSCIVNTAQKIADSMSAYCEVNVVKGYPPVYNNIELSNRIKNYAEEYVGTENVVDVEMRMTSDDFAFYGIEKPSCYYRLGTANYDKGITAGLHTPYFDIDEKSLITGMGFMAWVIFNELKR